MKSIQDITHVRYINLEHRTDRKEQVQNELRRIGWLEKSKRYNAVRLKDGRAGCTLSHLRCLEEAREAKLSHLVIVEDDIQFLNPALFTEQLDKFLSSGVDWDVILLAGNNLPPYVRVSDAAVKVTQCQTTTGYIVNERYYDKLIDNIYNGMKHLLNEPTKHFHYAIDKYWFNLQRTDRWFLITPLSVVQREGFSDIEQKNTNYVRAFIDLDKEELMRRAVTRRQQDS
jgi:GR25 family glycosyltransferase involved in LPS biosynthesis